MTPSERVLAYVRQQSHGASFLGIAMTIKVPEEHLQHVLRGMLNRKELELLNTRYFIPKPAEAIEETPMAETKRCRACDKDKPASEFYDGHAKCKPCFNIHNKANAEARKQREGKPAPVAKAVKPRKAHTPPERVKNSSPADLDLPATAGITLRMGNAVVELRTDPDVIVPITPSQMDAICSWWKARRAA
jgi:hypothetical protein